MNILAIGAHPDDIEYGCGGTLLRYKKSGHKIYLLVLTGGEESEGAEIRKREQKQAAELLGVEELLCGDFLDTRLVVSKEVISKIDSIIKRVSPDEIYVNYPDDTHQDHRACSEATITACRYQRRVLFYEDYTTQNFEPSIFTDIESVIDEKKALLALHSSQVKKIYPTGLDMLENMRAIASFRGFQGKVRYAEGFRALRYLLEL